MVDAINALRFSLNNDLYKLNTISQNLANVSTSGYKRELPVFSQYDSMLNAASDTQSLQKISNRDFSQSTLKYTANFSDISIDGDAFFTVKKDGNEYATRVGTLRINNEGKLAGSHDELFLGQSGEIQLEPGEFKIDETGAISQGGHIIDRLALVSNIDVKENMYVGNGFYTLDGNSSEKSTNAKVRQGFLETSNVKTMDEMVKLIETTRHFEALHNVLKAYDDVMNLSVNKLADF